MNSVKTLIGIVIISMMVALAGCNFSSGEKGKENYTREVIQEKLNSSSGISKVTWSADGKKVVYIQENINGDSAADKIYLWMVGEEKASAAGDAIMDVYSFTWAPDSQYFLISYKQGEKYESRIIKAEIIAEEKFKIASTDLPVWSPDSKSIVYSNGWDNYGENWGSMEVYSINKAVTEYIWRARNTQYRVEAWDKEGNIAYIENYEGKETRKTTKNIKPSISGVHLGDSMEQVRAALGEDYEETPPSEEMGHFPELVYRWVYDNGYTIFIGEKSGKVLEIMAISPEAETNLGVKVGDSAMKVFDTYRPHYIEPESIHGGKLYGLFKVEGAAALYFGFAMGEGESQYENEIKPEAKVERIMLTYPEQMDDSF